MNETLPNSLRSGPDSRGRFGGFGGRFVAETLMPNILEVQAAYDAARKDPAFEAEWRLLLKDYVGRPSPLWFAERLTKHLGGAKVYLKREELNHTGAHKINAVLGQILLAKRMGKTRVIAETGAGQHGVATATACALFDLPCTVFMGATDVARQKPNVFRMKLLGAEVEAVTSGAATLKDAMNEALRHWVAHVHDTYYCIGRKTTGGFMISSGEEELLDYDSRIDITRDTCPMTFVRTRLALDRMAPGQVLLVEMRGAEPVRNVPRTAVEQGHQVLAQDEAGEGLVRLWLRRGGA